MVREGDAAGFAVRRRFPAFGHSHGRRQCCQRRTTHSRRRRPSTRRCRARKAWPRCITRWDCCWPGSGNCRKPRSSLSDRWRCHADRPARTNRSGPRCNSKRGPRHGRQQSRQVDRCRCRQGRATLNNRTLATNGLIDLGYTLLARCEFADTRAYLHQALDLARQDKSPRSGSTRPPALQSEHPGAQLR